MQIDNLLCLTNSKGENLIPPIGYTPDVEEYQNWLKIGLAKFNKK